MGPFCCCVSCIIGLIFYSCLGVHTLPASVSLQSRGKHYTHQSREVDILVVTIQLRIWRLHEVTWKEKVKELTKGLSGTIASSCRCSDLCPIFVPLEMSVGITVQSTPLSENASSLFAFTAPCSFPASLTSLSSSRVLPKHLVFCR